MKENFKLPLVIIGVLGVVFSINGMLSGDAIGAGLLLIASTLAFGILYKTSK